MKEESKLPVVKVPQEQYLANQGSIKVFASNKIPHQELTVDTIIYSPEKNKLLSIVITKQLNDDLQELYPNSSIYYNNHTILGRKAEGGWRYFIPKGGSFVSYDLNSDLLYRKVKKWYLENYYFNNESNCFWNDKSIW